MSGDKPKRDPKGRWLPGQSANPAGKPRGVLEKRTLKKALERIEHELVAQVGKETSLVSRLLPAPPPGLEFLPIAVLARRHAVMRRTLHDELRRARATIIMVGTEPQVLESDYRAWIAAKAAEAQQAVADVGGEVAA